MSTTMHRINNRFSLLVSDAGASVVRTGYKADHANSPTPERKHFKRTGTRENRLWRMFKGWRP